MGQGVYMNWSSLKKTRVGPIEYQYEIHDWTNELHEDLQQDASNHDFRGCTRATTTSSCPTLMGPSTRTAASSPSKRVRPCRPRTLVSVTTSTPSASATPTATSCTRRRLCPSVSETVWAATTRTAVNRPSSAPPMKSPPRWATAKHRSPLASAPPWWKRPMSLHQASAPWLRWRPSVRRCSPAAAVCWTSKTPVSRCSAPCLGGEGAKPRVLNPWRTWRWTSSSPWLQPARCWASWRAEARSAHDHGRP